MWKPYLQVVAARTGGAIDVLARFHIIAHINMAIDEVRAAEHSERTAAGDGDLLNNMRYAFLKNPEKLTDKQALRMADILKSQHFLPVSGPVVSESGPACTENTAANTPGELHRRARYRIAP